MSSPQPTRILRWRWFWSDGEYNATVRAAARGAHGVYAFRDERAGVNLYVGESHTGRLWKTMLRHFQGLTSFAAVGEWTHSRRQDVEVKVWLTATGDDAVKLEEQIIRRLAPAEQERPEDEDREEVPF